MTPIFHEFHQIVFAFQLCQKWLSFGGGQYYYCGGFSM